GVEFAQMLNWFGCEVTLLEAGERILQREEPEISELLTQILEQEGILIRAQAEIQRISVEHGVKVIQYKHHGKLHQARGQEILIATGMRPQIAALNLKA